MSKQFQYYDTVAHGYTGILTINNAVLVTDGSGVPSFSTTIPSGSVAQSVSNSDGTLTISPTTGAVVASLALGHANTWTAVPEKSGNILQPVVDRWVLLPQLPPI